MTTVQQIYEEMQRIAPLALAESWDNPGLLVDCGGKVSRVLVTLDITPEVVEEAARKGCGLIVSHHPVIFSPLKKLSGQDVAFQLVKNGISAICMHTNLDAAEGGVNEVLAGIFGMREMEAFAEGCGRVGSIEPVTVPELAKKAQKELASRCNQPCYGVPGDGGGGGEAAHGLSGAGSPCERGCPGSLYLFIKRGNTNGIGCRDTGTDGGGAEDHAG